MAFQINAEVVLRGPTNIQQVTQQIKAAIGGVTANINIQLNQNALNSINQLNSSINMLNATIQKLTTTTAGVSAAMQQMGAAATQALQTTAQASRSAVTSLSDVQIAARQSGEAMFYFGEQTGLAVRRFAAFSIGAGAMLSALYSIKQGIAEAVTFDREMVRLAQVGSDTASGIRLVSTEISRLATSFGTSSRELAAASVTIRQAGYSATETARALETLAQASLSPNFGDMNQNATAAIAVMAQFKLKIDDLNSSFSAINAVAAAFPVSAKDITDAVIRAGGSFASIGGKLNEFVALFTSVKSVTQESSESIATGLRNIFTRLQTRDTLDRLREMQINLRYTADEARALGNINLTGQFLKPLEAIGRIQSALRGLNEGDQRYINILQAIGGTRQVGRALPLIREQGEQQRALDVANNSGGNLARQAEIGMESLSVRTTQVFEKFQEFFRLVINSDGFRTLADQLLKVANAFAEVLKFAAPIVPVLSVIAATKIASGVAPFLSGFTTKLAANSTATYSPFNAFASGGYASGGLSALTPGEAVIAPSNARSMGYGTLNKLNSGGMPKQAPAGNWTVPGVGNSDSELYHLPRGSFVIRKDSVKKMGLAGGGTPDMVYPHFAQGGIDLPLSSIGKKDFNQFSAQLGNTLYGNFLLENLFKTGAHRYIPGGSSLLGSGTSALAFREPGGDVFRAQPFIGQRPFPLADLPLDMRDISKWVAKLKQMNPNSLTHEPFQTSTFSHTRPNIEPVVQNLGSLLYGATGSNTLIERLPYVATYKNSELTQQKIMSLQARLAKYGYRYNDFNDNNIAEIGGIDKVLDAGGLQRLDEGISPLGITPTHRFAGGGSLEDALKIKRPNPFKFAGGFGVLGALGAAGAGLALGAFGMSPLEMALAGATIGISGFGATAASLTGFGLERKKYQKMPLIEEMLKETGGTPKLAGGGILDKLSFSGLFGNLSMDTILPGLFKGATKLAEGIFVPGKRNFGYKLPEMLEKYIEKQQLEAAKITGVEGVKKDVTGTLRDSYLSSLAQAQVSVSKTGVASDLFHPHSDIELRQLFLKDPDKFNVATNDALSYLQSAQAFAEEGNEKGSLDDILGHLSRRRKSLSQLQRDVTNFIPVLQPEILGPQDKGRKGQVAKSIEHAVGLLTQDDNGGLAVDFGSILESLQNNFGLSPRTARGRLNAARKATGFAQGGIGGSRFGARTLYGYEGDNFPKLKWNQSINGLNHYDKTGNFSIQSSAYYDLDNDKESYIWMLRHLQSESEIINIPSALEDYYKSGSPLAWEYSEAYQHGLKKKGKVPKNYFTTLTGGEIEQAHNRTIEPRVRGYDAGTIDKYMINHLKDFAQILGNNTPFETGIDESLLSRPEGYDESLVNLFGLFKNFKTHTKSSFPDWLKANKSKGMAQGGSYKDTVPALLTPGEYVFSPEATSRIGLANLDRMNRGGTTSHFSPNAMKIAGFNRGGYVKGHALGDVPGEYGLSNLPDPVSPNTHYTKADTAKYLASIDRAAVIMSDINKVFEYIGTKRIYLPKTPKTGVNPDDDFDSVLSQMALKKKMEESGVFRTRDIDDANLLTPVRDAARARKMQMGGSKFNYRIHGNYGLGDPTASGDIASSGNFDDVYDFAKIQYMSSSPFLPGVSQGFPTSGLPTTSSILRNIAQNLALGRPGTLMPWHNQQIGHGGFSNSPQPVSPGYGGFGNYLPMSAGYGGFSNLASVSQPPAGFGGFSRYTNSTPPSGPPNIGYGGFSGYAQTPGYGGFSNFATPPTFAPFGGFPPGGGGGGGRPPFINAGNFGNPNPLPAQPNPFSLVPGFQLPNVLTLSEYNKDRQGYEKMLADFYKKQVDVESKGLQASEKNLAVTQKVAQTRAEMVFLEQNHKQALSAQVEVLKLQSKVKSGATLSTDEESALLKAQNDLNKFRLQRSQGISNLTFKREGSEFAKLGGDEVGGGGFFDRLFGKGTKFQALNARIEAASTGIAILSSYAGNILSANAGTADEAARNSAGGSFVAGRAFSTAAIYGGLGTQLGALLGPGGAIAGGIAGGIYGGISGTSEAGKELKLADFALNIERSSNAIKNLTEAVDRLGGRISNEEIRRLGGLTSTGFDNAEQQYTLQRYGTVVEGLSNLIPLTPIIGGPNVGSVRSIFGYNEELRQGQDDSTGLTRAFARFNPFSSNESLAASENARQRDIRFQNEGRQNPELLSAINRQILGVIRNSLSEQGGLQLSDNAIRRRITNTVSERDLNIFAATRGFQGNDRIQGLLRSEFFSSNRSQTQNQLLLSGVGSPTEQVIFGMGRFNKELQAAADSLEGFGKASSVISSVFTGSSQLGGVNSILGRLANPLKNDNYLGAVDSATAGLGVATPLFRNQARLSGQLSTIAPDVLRGYLSGGGSIEAQNQTLDERLRERLGVNANSRESSFITNFSQQLIGRLQGQRESFQNPNIAEEAVQKLLAEGLQPIVELTRQRERIAQNTINIEQQILNLNLRRAETLGRVADADFDLLRIREQQRNLRETGVATNPLLTGITFNQADQPFRARVNALGRNAGVDSNTSIEDLRAIATSSRQAYENARTAPGLDIGQRSTALTGFENKIIAVTRILDLYANSTQRAAYFQDQLGRNQAERTNRIDLQRRFLTGSNEERLDLFVGRNVSQFVLGRNRDDRQAAFNSLGDPARQAYIRYADATSNIRVPGGRPGETQGTELNRLIQGMIGQDILGPLNQDQENNESELASIMEQMSEAANALAGLQQEQIGFLQSGLLSENNTQLNQLRQSIEKLTLRIENPPAAQPAVVGPLGGLVGPPAPTGQEPWQDRPGLLQRMGRLFGFATGGSVYANAGRMIPQGTDTVPAMLTPNEFVVNARSATANRGLLEMINNTKHPINFADLPRHLERPLSMDRYYGMMAGRGAAENIYSAVGGMIYRANGGPTVDRSNESVFAWQNLREAGLWPFRSVGHHLFGLSRTPPVVQPRIIPGTGTNPYTPITQTPTNTSNPYNPINTSNPYTSITGSNEYVAPTRIPITNLPFRQLPNQTNEPPFGNLPSNSYSGIDTASASTGANSRLSLFAQFSPVGIENVSTAYGPNVAAAYYQGQATSNLLRQQLYSQTHTTGLFGSRFGGASAVQQRQQQAATLGGLAQANRRYLEQQPSLNTENQLLRYLGPRRYANGGPVYLEDGGDVREMTGLDGITRRYRRSGNGWSPIRDERSNREILNQLNNPSDGIDWDAMGRAALGLGATPGRNAPMEFNVTRSTSGLPTLGEVLGGNRGGNLIDWDIMRRQQLGLSATPGRNAPMSFGRGMRRFASGGYVDNIPAMLSEGEFVMNQAATRNIGPANLARMQQFAQGGLVGGESPVGGSLGDNSELMTALNNFSNNNRELVEALAAFPHTIEGSFTHTHNINVTGLAALESAEGPIKEWVTGIAEEMINNMLKTRLPDIGGTIGGA